MDSQSGPYHSQIRNSTSPPRRVYHHTPKSCGPVPPSQCHRRAPHQRPYLPQNCSASCPPCVLPTTGNACHRRRDFGEPCTCSPYTAGVVDGNHVPNALSFCIGGSAARWGKCRKCDEPHHYCTYRNSVCASCHAGMRRCAGLLLDVRRGGLLQLRGEFLNHQEAAPHMLQPRSWVHICCPHLRDKSAATD
jgi:hypothetical protein